MVIKDYEFVPFATVIDANDIKDTYSRLKLTSEKAKEVNKDDGGIQFRSTLAYPFAFCFYDEDTHTDKPGLTYVYHALLLFSNLPDSISEEKNSIVAMNRLTSQLNRSVNKAVLVKDLKERLDKQRQALASENKLDDEALFDDGKCIAYCEDFLASYYGPNVKLLPLDIVPLHMNINNDNTGSSPSDTYDYNHTNVKKFSSRPRDKKEEALIDALNTESAHYYANVIMDKDERIEIDKYVTLYRECGEDITLSYDLYTFVVSTFDLASGTYQQQVLNIFWDGDDPSYDDTIGNIDRVIDLSRSLSGSVNGFDYFVELLEHNKHINPSLYVKMKSYQADNSGGSRYKHYLTAAYRVNLRYGVQVNGRNIDWDDAFVLF